jgi:CheY-like chemotaxis protein
VSTIKAFDMPNQQTSDEREEANRASSNIIIFVGKRNQRLIQEMLYAGHYNSVISVSGKDAEAMIHSGNCDVLIADADNPPVDNPGAPTGIIAAAQSAGIKPLLLAEHISANDEKAYRAAGVKVILQQPISMSALFSAIEKVRAPH